MDGVRRGDEEDRDGMDGWEGVERGNGILMMGYVN